jgi:mandelate racemase
LTRHTIAGPRRSSLALASQQYPEISVHLLTASPTTHLLAASPTAHLLEYMPWAQPIMAEKLVIEDGSAVVPHRPGLGLVFDEQAIARFAIE